MNAFKSFPPIPDASGVHRWLRILAVELAGRLLEDRVKQRRTPKLLILQYRPAGALHEVHFSPLRKYSLGDTLGGFKDSMTISAQAETRSGGVAGPGERV